MESAVLQAISDLGTGVASILVLYLSYKIFDGRLQKKDEQFQSYVNSVQRELIEQLSQNANIMARVVHFLETHNHEPKD